MTAKGRAADVIVKSVGDRVRFAPSIARYLITKNVRRLGTVIKIIDRNRVRVLWDGRKTSEVIHVDLLDVVVGESS